MENVAIVQLGLDRSTQFDQAVAIMNCHFGNIAEAIGRLKWN